jgi:energy-coupling factor transporter ATP-binding protein EcfA2
MVRPLSGDEGLGFGGLHLARLKLHASGAIYVGNEEVVRSGQVAALTLFPTDQIIFARILADRRACYLHAAGFVLDGKGFVFLGHSGAGKSTMVTMLKDRAQAATDSGEGTILCDDRVVVRRWPEGFRVHGTWSHGDVDEVSPESAPLAALLILEQAPTNRLSAAMSTRKALRTLPQFVVRPLVTADWWEKTLGLIGDGRQRACASAAVRPERRGGGHPAEVVLRLTERIVRHEMSVGVVGWGYEGRPLPLLSALCTRFPSGGNKPDLDVAAHSFGILLERTH